MTLRTFGWITLAVVVAFAAGWAIGASGRATLALELGRADERAGFSEARALVSEGSAGLLDGAPADARERFGEARAVLERLQTRLRERGQVERAGQLEIALSQLTDVERLAGSDASGARSAAEAALRTLEIVATGESSPSARR